MTSTLVLGGTRSGKSRHAESLLREHDQVTFVATRYRPLHTDDPDMTARIQRHRSRRPASWTTVESRDLTKALLGSRHPVLVDSVADWLWGQLDENDLWEDPQRAMDHIEDLLDELTVAIRALPFDTVIVTQEPTWDAAPGAPKDRLVVELLAHANQRLSATCQRVHAVIVGRVIDLSDAPLVAR